MAATDLLPAGNLAKMKVKAMSPETFAKLWFDHDFADPIVRYEYVLKEPDIDPAAWLDEQPITTSSEMVVYERVPVRRSALDYPDVIEIMVTQADIDQGVRRSPSQCAVSRAVNRRFDGVSAETGSGSIILHEPNRPEAAVYLAKNEYGRMSQWISDFDHGRPVQPTTFRLERVTHERQARVVFGFDLGYSGNSFSSVKVTNP
jgi:hypothetical protein